jgi:molybdate transport system substrate-binding protein
MTLRLCLDPSCASRRKGASLLQGPQEARIVVAHARYQWPRCRAPRGKGGIVGKWSINVLLGSALVLASASAMQAAELQVIAGGGIAGPLNELAILFERASGHKLVIRYGTAPELIKMATSGVAFDLGVVPQDVWKDAAARAQLAPGPTPDIARVGLGVAVRTGAPKPDIGTPAALKQTLLKAQSVASIPASATGTQLAGIYERLGITEERKAKTKAQPAPKQIVEAVANGEAELAVFVLNVLIDPRLDIVGPFPAEVQREVVYAAGVAANSKTPEAAKAFVAYLMSPPAIAVIKAKGMNPG